MGMVKKKKVEKFFHYGQLGLRNQVWVDGYLEQHPEMSKSNRSFHRVKVSKFLLHLEEKGVVFPEELTHDDVLCFVRERGDGSCLKDFLRYVEEVCHSGRHFIGACAVRRYARNIISTEDMEKWESVESSSVEEFMRASEEVSAWMEACDYSTESKSEFQRAISQMGIFLERNGLRFSRPLACAWIKAMARRNDMAEHPYRWVLEVASRLESCDGTKKSRKESEQRALPEWSIPLLKEYLSTRRQDGMAKSTVKMDRCSLTRFIRHLEESGCQSFAGVTPAMVVGFHLGDTMHKTPEAKNAYNTRVRMFLRFLSLKKIVPYSLSEALPQAAGIQQRPVRTLSMGELEALERSFESQPNRNLKRTHLRNIAILKLELYMGLRHSDAKGLRFGDVDAKQMKVSLAQAKTGRRMEIPLPATVLNSILRYVRDERPSLESPYIFLTSKVPYKPLATSVQDSKLREIVGGNRHHILRKTFATNLLQGGNGIAIITDLLGHSNECNIHKYLDTDSETMRSCSIPLDGISYTGGLL